MEDHSVFMDKSNVPDEEALKLAIGEAYGIFQEIRDHVYDVYPDGIEEWNFPGKKYGWSFRIKDKKRAILYFLPMDGYFKAAFVFGQKACNYIADSDIDKKIIDDLLKARKYAEGRGVSIVASKELLPDIKKLVDIKMMF